MAEASVTKCRGLVTQRNPLTVSEGALVRADNAVIRREDVIENRRGYAEYATLSSEPLQSMIFEGRDRVLVHDGTNVAHDNGSGTFENYAGTFTAPTGYKMRFQAENTNLYITTTEGIKVLENVDAVASFTANTATGSNTLTAVSSIAGVEVGKLITGTGIPAGTYVASTTTTTIVMTKNATANGTGVSVSVTSAARQAGAPRALGPGYTLVTGTTLTKDFQTAYRVLVERIDSNDNVYFGYPSERLWVVNNSPGNRDVSLSVYLSSDMRATDIIQVYRTLMTHGLASDNAGDEMALVYQYTLTQADILAGVVTVVDVVTDELRGAALYTNESQEGIGQANSEPPLSIDLTLFKQFMFYANTQTKQRLFTSMISTNGLYNAGAYGGSLVIAGVTYTGAATENSAIGQFKVSNTGIAASDIDATARSLVNVINRYASNTTVFAYYASGPDDLPGQILLEAKSFALTAFTIQSSSALVGADFFPVPPQAPNTTAETTSSNTQQQNAVYFSKESQPEAVPLLNYFLVGPSNTPILRIAALRDSLIIIKEEGVYRLTGETPQSFNVTPLDLTVKCKAAASVAVLTNQVMMMSNQGVVAVTDTDAQVVSRDIEPSLLPLLTYSNFATYTYGIAYDSDRLYMLSTIQSNADIAPVQTFVYNVFTQSWTRWTFAFTTGIVEPSVDKLFFSKSGISLLYRERKNFTKEDYADPEIDITITAISGDEVTFIPASGTPLVGWVISQGSNEIKIEEITDNGSSFTAVMKTPPPPSWAPGAALIFPGIPMAVEWDAWTAGGPAMLKQGQEMKILTDTIEGNNAISDLTATFRTDIDRNIEEQMIDSGAEGWGTSPWSSMPWGGISETYSYRTYFPQSKSYFRVLNAGCKHANAKEKISLNGYGLTFRMISERVSR